MVPSWTEMLIQLNIPVVGRTRFCIEPTERVKQIPTVGGTKDWNWAHIESLNPDLLILDKEENPKFMSENHSIPFVATHVQNIESCAQGIDQINIALSSHISKKIQGDLENLSQRWRNIKKVSRASKNLYSLPYSEWPDIIEWIEKPTEPISSIYYLIWKNPWMVASRNTFIGDLCSCLGIEISPVGELTKYPQLELDKLDAKKTLLLFSSEPFPFHKKKSEIKNLGFPAALVDGQSFSWFGIRSLVFLENQMLKK